MAIANEHITHYREHGFAVVENFLAPALLAAAREEIEALLPGWLDYADNPQAPKPDHWNEPGRSRRTLRFPFVGRALNDITLHPDLQDFAKLMTGGEDIVCEQSDLTYKCRGHYADSEQVMHLDYMNHTLVYPPDLPKYWQTAFLLYYSDVSIDQAPTAVTSWQAYRDELLWPAAHTRDERPALYDKEVKVTVPAGSLLAYSMRTFHRGTAFQADGARVGHFISYAPKNPRWMGIVGWPEQGVHAGFASWMVQASPAERALVGFPDPGDPYWTGETRAGVAARFPGIDLSVY